MKSFRSAVAVLSLLLCLPCANADVFDLQIGFLELDYGDPGISAIGTLATTGGTGIFTLASGISSFTVSGSARTSGFFDGPFTLGIGDLSLMQLTLQDGAVQDFHLATKDFVVPGQAFGQGPVTPFTVHFSIDGLSGYNTKMTALVPPSSTFSAQGFAGVTPVPEPSTLALLVAGLGLGGTVVRRRVAARLHR